MTRYTRLLALVFGSFLTGGITLLAQAPSDALRNMSEGTGGTARAQAMGGTIGALGADPSAIVTNPAGSALFYKGSISFSFDADGNYYYPYIDTRQPHEAGSKWSAGLSGASFISSPMGGGSSPWSFNYGLIYNRDYDYTRSYGINFEMPNSTVSDFMAFRANAAGVPWEEYMYEGDSYDPILVSGLDPIVVMGMNSGIIEYDGDLQRFQPGAWSWSGEPEVSDMVFLLPNVSNLTVHERGTKNSFDFNVSGSYDSRLFFGASLRMGTSHFTRNSEYTEEFYYEPKDNEINLTYDNDLSVSGSTFGLNLGLLYALGDYGRVGISYLAPQYGRYEELYHASAGTYNNAIIGDPDMGYNTGDDLSNSYSMWLPGKLTLSGMAFLGRWGMVTYDFTWRNLSSAKLNGGNGDPALEGPNELMDAYFGNEFGHHLGVEVVPTSWLSLRAGASYLTSGVRLQSDRAVLSEEYVASGTILDFALPRGSYTASAGLGLRFGAFSADFAYVYGLQKNEVYPYPANPIENFSVEGANMDIDRHSLFGTLTLTF